MALFSLGDLGYPLYESGLCVSCPNRLYESELAAGLLPIRITYLSSLSNTCFHRIPDKN